MNNKTLLSATILLILAKPALSIEVEPNNDSKTANPLGLENVGQLSKGSDVDFFSIDNSCIKYTVDDANLDISGDIKAGDCAKYKDSDEAENPTNIAGEDKYRSEISLAFSCNSRAAVGTAGWYLGVHDSRGVLQASYQVKANDCMVGTTGFTGPYNLKFPSSPDVSNYYLSVVADCHLPIYNASNDPLKPIISANTFVQSTPATKADIDAAQAEIIKAKKVLTAAINELNNAKFSVIGSNDSIAKANDAISMAKDIADQSKPNLTAATSINAASSTAKAVGIMADAMRYSVQSHTLFIDADKAAKAPAVQTAVDVAKIALTVATSNDDQAATVVTTTTAAAVTAASDLKLADNLLASQEQNLASQTAIDPLSPVTALATVSVAKAKITQDNAIAAKNTADAIKAAADAAKKITADAKAAANIELTKAQNVQTNLKQIQTNTQADDTAATTKLGEANTALANAVTVLNTTVNADIAAANAATDSGSRTNNSCTASNNATYTITDTQENLPKNTQPTVDLPSNLPSDLPSDLLKKVVALGTNKTGQISAIDDNDVYLVESGGATDIPLIFSCSPMAVRKSDNWKVEIYDDANELVSSELINGSDCGSGFRTDNGGYKFNLPPTESTRYYLSVKSACTKAGCIVDTSDYNIARDVTKTYKGVLVTTKKTTIKTADFQLKKCGSTSNAIINVKAENVNLKKKLTPINVQIGSMACQTAAPLIANSLPGTVVKKDTENSLTDSELKAKDKFEITLGDCGVAKGKVTLSGSGLDLEDLNFDNAVDSVSIPIKVDFGDFHCSGEDTFDIKIDDKTDDIIYSKTPVVTTTIKQPCFYSECIPKEQVEKDFPVFGTK
jgi:hypothetical protein